jgi:hypothetical protein
VEGEQEGDFKSRALKSEIRNTKHETNPNVEVPKMIYDVGCEICNF